jgi:hypothetical protein
MARVVVVIGAMDGVRREVERQLQGIARLLIIRLARSGGFRLEPHPTNSVQMLEAAADEADNYPNLLILELPYARCEEPLAETIRALEDLGATVRRPRPGEEGWPTRPKALDERFRVPLQAALLQAIFEWVPRPEVLETREDPALAIDRARGDFSDTLEIPTNIAIDTSLDGAFWYGVLQALNDLCLKERQGDANNKRELLRVLLKTRVGLAKGNYKSADTGVYLIAAGTGERIHLRERVHLREGKPALTESIYWQTIGEKQSTFRYLVGRIGRHG